MSNLSVERNVCCYVLKGTHLLFSDERIKFHLLKQIDTLQKQEGWSIYGFCLTDDEAYFIAEAENEERVQKNLQLAAEQILNQMEYRLWGYHHEGRHFHESIPERLYSLEEIANRCRQIHRLPIMKGYVNRMNDYWWSSYNTYVDTFNWAFMDVHILLLYFSTDHEEAVCRFRRFHRTYQLSS